MDLRKIVKVIWLQQFRDFILHVSNKVAEIGEKQRYSRRKQEINSGKAILGFAFVMFLPIYVSGNSSFSVRG